MKKLILIIIALAIIGCGYWVYSKYHYPKVDFITVSIEATDLFSNCNRENYTKEIIDLLRNKYHMKTSMDRTKSDNQFVAKLQDGLVLHIVTNPDKMLIMIVHETSTEKKQTSTKLINTLRKKLAERDVFYINVYNENTDFTAIQLKYKITKK